MPDPPRDPRTFRKYVKWNTDGTVAAVIEVDAGVDPTLMHGGALLTDVTAVDPVDVEQLTINPTLVAGFATIFDIQASAEQAVKSAAATLAAQRAGAAGGVA